jgi:hypothetical protein
MSKVYLPPGLPAGIGPFFNRLDIVYMKFVKEGVTVRVARFDPEEGPILALYPTENPDIIEGEGFCRIEDKSKKRTIEKSEIKDEVWLDLLDGKGIPDILSKYPFEMLGVHPSGSYKFGEGDEFRTFHIVEMEEPGPQN